MSATLGDTFLLSSYTLPSRSTTASASRADRLVYASHCPVPHTNDGQVTVAVQGDGLHIFDLAEAHPVNALTLGPSVRFACAPASFIVSEGGSDVRKTIAAIRSAPGVASDDEGRTVWSWEDSLSNEMGAQKAKQAAILPHEIYQLLQADDGLICVSHSGFLTRLDRNLQTLSQWTPTEGKLDVLKVFAWPLRDCAFKYQVGNLVHGTLLVTFGLRDTRLEMQSFVFGHDKELVRHEPQDIPLPGAKLVIDVSCDQSGHMSFLTQDGVWTHAKLDFHNGQATVTLSPESLHLQGLLFIKSTKEHSGSRTNATVSTLSLGSSFVLLTGITSPADAEMALLLWDIQYGVLLDSHTLPIPSTLETTSPSRIVVDLVRGNAHQALLMLTPDLSQKPLSSSRTAQVRSSILVIPFTVAPISTIAAVLGRWSHGTKWLVPDTIGLRPSTSEVSTSKLAPSEDSREQLLTNMQEAVEEGRPRDAETLFHDWIKSESTASKEPAEQNARSDEGDGVVNTSKYTNDERRRRPREESKVTFSHTFITRILHTILQSEAPSGSDYPKKVLHTLLDRRVVSHSMVEGGLLSALLQRSDWESTTLVLRKVTDIPESDILHVLRKAVDRLREEAAPANDFNMDVDIADGTSSIPELRSVLAACLPYPSTPIALRLAIREHLSDPEHLISLLRVIQSWIEEWLTRDLAFGFGEVAVGEHGMIIAKQKSKRAAKKRSESLPNLEKILTFLQAILDSSFLTLLHHRSSHELLRILFDLLTPHITFNDEMEHLRGPLYPFVIAHAKAVADTRGGNKKEKLDWRKLGKQRQDQDSINIGLYRVEELAF